MTPRLSPAAEAFMEALQAAIWNKPLHLPDDIWLSRDFWILAQRQKCSHMMAVFALENNAPVPDPTTYKMAVYQVLQRQVRQDRLMTDLVQLLDEHHIQATVIKGFGLARLYPKNEMRDYCDVDLYVGPEQYYPATDVIKAAYPDDYWHSDTEGGIHFILVLDKDLDRIAEIHRVAMEFADAQADRAWQAFTAKHIHEQSQTVQVNGAQILMPGHYFNSLYVFLHAWHHFEGGGVGLRQIADWALCLHALAAQQTDEQRRARTDELRQVLTQMHMLEVWQTFAYVLVHRLGLPQDEMPLYTPAAKDKAERLFLQLILEGHAYRSAKAPAKGLMRLYPHKRPESGRLRQRAYTAAKLLFEWRELSKFFPGYAWHELIAKLRLGLNKHA
ncbi:MAG: nucleotidyltransferase family protein [Paludibacteraceae bacterium]|nr:nucleotidyltransferase family protein [Paludibacteraceae bacterium]MBR1480839.1 nucleotidyltransferase family protein [Paludibacteraceae bacterium]